MRTYAGSVNASDWATELLSRHAAVVSRVQVEVTKAMVDDGEGWLAAYDLFREGLEDGWLTVRDLTEARELARAGAFSPKLSPGIERDAQQALQASALTS